MKKILQLFIVIFILTGIALSIWYGGGIALVIALGVLGLTGLIAISFLLGSHWTYRLLRAGARIAIDSNTVSEQADALKMKALANLVTQTVKQFDPNGAAASETPRFPAITPLLPDLASLGSPPPQLPGYVAHADFTIAGLDEDEPDNNEQNN